MAQETQSKEHLKMAQNYFQLVGASASEVDTIPGEFSVPARNDDDIEQCHVLPFVCAQVRLWCSNVFIFALTTVLMPAPDQMFRWRCCRPAMHGVMFLSPETV